MLDVVREQLEAIRAAGTWKNERVITSSQSHSISVQSSKEKVLVYILCFQTDILCRPLIYMKREYCQDYHFNKN